MTQEKILAAATSTIRGLPGVQLHNAIVAAKANMARGLYPPDNVWNKISYWNKRCFAAGLKETAKKLMSDLWKFMALNLPKGGE